MKYFEEGQEATVSVKALYNSGYPLTYGEIKLDYNENGEVDYYDLFNEDGVFACCDGEQCVIEQVGAALVTLVNNYGESTVHFTLTKEEAEEALFIAP